MLTPTPVQLDPRRASLRLEPAVDAQSNSQRATQPALTRF